MSNPYTIVPPLGRLLDVIIAHCGVGETISPGNRTLAKWLGLASIGGIPDYIAQLVADEWIVYDPRGGMITLLRDYRSAGEPDLIPLSDHDSFDPYLDSPDAIIDYLMFLPRQRPRSGGAA
jgi:hypothetical protein